MDPKMIQHGGRKASVITKEELELLFKAAVPYDSEDLFDCAFMECHPSPLPKVMKDLEKIQFDIEDVSCDGIKVSANGVPFFWVLAYGESNCPVGFMMYFDGKDLRGYIPVYGNTFNPKTKTAFGYEEESDRDYTGTYSYVEDGVAKTITIHDEEEFEAFLWNTLSDVDPCEEACFEAFDARVIAEGSMTHEEVLAAAKKLKAKTEKLFWDE